MCKTQVPLLPAVLLLCIAASQALAVEDPNLIGWWTFDDGSGSVAKDASGKGKEATLLGGPEWVPGNTGGSALSFDAVDDIVQVDEVPGRATAGKRPDDPPVALEAVARRRG